MDNTTARLEQIIAKEQARSNVLPLKPGVGHYVAMHASPTARDFILANFYPPGPFTRIFPNLSQVFFSCVSCGQHWFRCGPAKYNQRQLMQVPELSARGI